MANSPITVLPEPVGAVKTTEFPLLIALIASIWKGSRGNGKYSSKLSNNCDWRGEELTSWDMIYIDINKQ